MSKAKIINKIEFYQQNPLTLQEHSFGVEVEGKFTGTVEHGGEHRDTYYFINDIEVDRTTAQSDDELELVISKAIEGILGHNLFQEMLPGLPPEFQYEMIEDDWVRQERYKDSETTYACDVNIEKFLIIDPDAMSGLSASAQYHKDSILGTKIVLGINDGLTLLKSMQKALLTQPVSTTINPAEVSAIQDSVYINVHDDPRVVEELLSFGHKLRPEAFEIAELVDDIELVFHRIEDIDYKSGENAQNLAYELVTKALEMQLKSTILKDIASKKIQFTNPTSLETHVTSPVNIEYPFDYEKCKADLEVLMEEPRRILKEFEEQSFSEPRQ